MNNEEAGLLRLYSTFLRKSASVVPVLLYAAVAFALNGVSGAQAIMGEDPANRGLVIEERDVKEGGEVLLACVLGAACQTEDEFFFRRMAVGQIVEGGTIEEGIGFAGIGFGSLLSSTPGPVDILCWTGAGEPERQCVRIEGSEASNSVTGEVIAASEDSGSECADEAEAFGFDGEFDYLVKFFEDKFGAAEAVSVVTCDGVNAVDSPPGAPLQAGVSITAQRGMAAYDLRLYGGGYCCR